MSSRRNLTPLFGSALGAIALSGCATTSVSIVPPALTAEMPATLRARCTGVAPPSDDQLAALAGRSADQREVEFWMPRESEWIGAISDCEDRRAGAVAVSDAQNTAALELKGRLEKPAGLRGLIRW